MGLNLVVNNKNNNIEQEGETVVDLKLIGGSNTPPQDWLSELDVGTMFLVEAKAGHDFVLGAFKLMSKTERSVVLFNSGSQNPIFVNPKRFCTQYRMYEALGIMPEGTDQQQEEEKDEDNGEGDRLPPDDGGSDGELAVSADVHGGQEGIQEPKG